MSAGKIVLHILGVCVSVLILIALFFGFIKLGTLSYETGYRIFTEKPVELSPGTDKEIEIPQGISALELATLLEEKGLVKDNYVFFLQMKLSAYGKKVKPGEYTLNTSQTAREMLQIMGTEENTQEDEESTEDKTKKESAGKIESQKDVEKK